MNSVIERVKSVRVARKIDGIKKYLVGDDNQPIEFLSIDAAKKHILRFKPMSFFDVLIFEEVEQGEK